MSGSPSLTGNLSGGAALSWTGVSVSNSPYTTVYYVYRSTWDASTYTWLDNSHNIAGPTGLSYTDSPSKNIYSVTGSKPNPCVNSYVQYNILAYNGGRSSASNTVYFVGDADGPNPNQINCQ
jgi:hypothetical protein